LLGGEAGICGAVNRFRAERRWRNTRYCRITIRTLVGVVVDLRATGFAFHKCISINSVKMGLHDCRANGAKKYKHHKRNTRRKLVIGHFCNPFTPLPNPIEINKGIIMSQAVGMSAPFDRISRAVFTYHTNE